MGHWSRQKDCSYIPANVKPNSYIALPTTEKSQLPVWLPEFWSCVLGTITGHKLLQAAVLDGYLSNTLLPTHAHLSSYQVWTKKQAALSVQLYQVKTQCMNS